MTNSILEDDKAGAYLILYWNIRNQVPPESRCRVKIEYEDGTTGRCVLARAHNNGEWLESNIPHADKHGRMAAQTVSWQTLRDIREYSEADVSMQEAVIKATAAMRNFSNGWYT